MRGFEQMVDLLVTKGADVTAKDSADSDALYIAADACWTDVVARLVRAGVNVDTREAYHGKTPLMAAAGRCGNTRLLDLLVAGGADVNAEDKLNKTALDYAEDASRAGNTAFLQSKGGKTGTPAGHGLEIISPRHGVTFTEGDTVTLIVKPTSQSEEIVFIAFSVGIRGRSPCDEEISSPPYQCAFVIPPGSAPRIKVSAMGKTVQNINSDDALVSPTVTVLVKMPSTVTLREIRVSTGSSSDTLFLVGGRYKKHLYVEGLFSDGTKRRISASGLGTTYETSDPLIVTVDSEGSVRPVAPGNATITVRNSGREVTVPVKVEPGPKP
jgi:hypothetical protein